MRNFVFGVEDSLVSTVGLLSGISIADVPRSTIFLTGIVLIFVEAFSMGVGSFLSEHSAESLSRADEVPHGEFLGSTVLMFSSYFVSGFIPLFPYLLLPIGQALWLSTGCSLAALFGLGLIGGWLSRGRLVATGLKMMLIGGAAIALGVIVGKLVNIIN